MGKGCGGSCWEKELAKGQGLSPKEEEAAEQTFRAWLGRDELRHTGRLCKLSLRIPRGWLASSHHAQSRLHPVLPICTGRSGFPFNKCKQ